MSDWILTSDRLPDDQQECDILSHDEKHILLGVAFTKQMGGWFDFFATPEASEVYTPSVVIAWRQAQEITLPTPNSLTDDHGEDVGDCDPTQIVSQKVRG